MKKALRVGLTGGIASGKTAVTQFFAQSGVPVIDADVIAHEVVRQEMPAYKAIVSVFGDSVIDEHGNLRRKHLRQLIFNDRNLKNQLESIIHPLVRTEIECRSRNPGFPYCIISIPLLIESGQQNNFDRILVIDVPESIQLERASNRDGVSLEEIRKIIATQTPRKERLVQADDIITNDKDLTQLQQQVISLHNKYLEIAAS